MLPRKIFEAVQEACKQSRDIHTQIGCVLFDPVYNTIIATGCNDLSPGVDPVATPEVLERPLKYEYFEHAERNAVYKCFANGLHTQGLSAYCTAFPCSDCARCLVFAGIRVLYASPNEYGSGGVSDVWKAKCDAAVDILKRGGVLVRSPVFEEKGRSCPVCGVSVSSDEVHTCANHVMDADGSMWKATIYGDDLIDSMKSKRDV